MQVIETVADFRAIERTCPRPLGLVPTMGYLHEGHLSLVRQARADNATAAASIFVNPTQFGENEDLSTYPRDMDGDLDKLKREGVDLVFAPPASEVYPPGFDTSIDVGAIASRLEGAHRPGHFTGVATVVCKLLTIVRPDNVYFGQKDAQQCLVVKRLNADLNLGANVVVMPTVRDADGLALSSRNAYLAAEDRQSALALSRALRFAETMCEEGVRDAATLRSQITMILNTVPNASIDYISIADAETLEELTIIDRPALVSLAVHIGRVRLIDNVVLTP
ncbi:MAG: pantoate--beta-alanine ligase [Dehalococcoidia bacterium]|nr:pantoate--beta-alanine ligase [Dehalococcoidia bacterium]